MVKWLCIFLFSLLCNLWGVQQVAHVSIGGKPDTLDPRKSNNVHAAFLIEMLFQGLTEIEPDGSVSPLMAEQVEIAEDEKTYTFHLRDSCWSDGAPVTADDFVFAWKSCLEPQLALPCANLLYVIKNAEAAKKGSVSLDQVGVRAKDAKTLIVELERPIPFFLDLVAATIFYPIPKHIASNNPLWATSPTLVSNGPFKCLSQQPLLFAKNPYFWNAAKVILEKIDIALIEDEREALRLFEEGKLDWLGGEISPLPIDALPRLKQEGKLRKTVFNGTRYCALNTASFPFHNINMRKAFALAINRQTLAKTLPYCEDEIADNMIASCFKNGQKFSLFKDGDLEEARSYFKKGIEELKINPEQFVITFRHDDSEVATRIAQELQRQWKEVLGIQVVLKSRPLKEFVEHLRKRDFQIGLIYWMLHYNNPMDILDRYRSKDLLKNYPGWENNKYTSLLDTYFITQESQPRLEILKTAEELFISEMPVIPLLHFSRPYLQQEWLQGVQTTPIGDFFFDKAYLTSAMHTPSNS